MIELLEKIKQELIIRFFPFDISIRRNYLFNKYLKQVRFRGRNVILKKDGRFIRPKGLILGNDVTIEGGGVIDATAGVLIGDKCTIKSKVNILTAHKDSDRLNYAPVIIGAGNEVDENIIPGTILPNKIPTKGLSQYEGQIVFVVSTGRSGSKAIADFINGHPEAECYHDSFPHIYSWSCDILYNRKTSADIKKKIETLYDSLNIGSKKVHGQSDQKLTPLIPILAASFPNAKFLWIIRKADSFVNSSYPRGWFDNSEFNLPENPKEFFEKKVTPSSFDAAHRTNGILVNKISKGEWEKMTAFERNCWYWSFWNNLIEENLKQLNSEKWIMVKLNEMNQQHDRILQFLGLPKVKLNSSKSNVAKYKKIGRSDWNESMEEIYKKHCQIGMKKWFNAES